MTTRTTALDMPERIITRLSYESHGSTGNPSDRHHARFLADPLIIANVVARSILSLWADDDDGRSLRLARSFGRGNPFVLRGWEVEVRRSDLGRHDFFRIFKGGTWEFCAEILPLGKIWERFWKDLGKIFRYSEDETWEFGAKIIALEKIWEWFGKDPFFLRGWDMRVWCKGHCFEKHLGMIWDRSFCS